MNRVGVEFDTKKSVLDLDTLIQIDEITVVKLRELIEAYRAVYKDSRKEEE